MTLALYRKYRPRTFSEIIGQEHVTEPLSQALRSGNINHAYLFSGPRGCGKTSSARILARSLNCEKGPTPDPCGVCDSCRALAPDGAGSIDVIEIDAASHGGVDDARDLRERAFFAPVSSRYKIYVIDEAHMVSSAGFNALLKLVEEPPEYVKFVFATTEPEKVLGTIKSRTHHYPFRLIPPGILRPYLEQLATAEGAKVEPAVFPLVVRAGGGSARDSLSVLDQLIAGAGDAGVTYARAVALLGVTDAALIDEVCDALAAGDGAAVYSTIHRVAEAGHEARRFAGDLLERLRNLIVLQQVPEAIEKGLLDGADDELARMRVQSERFGPATLSRMADIVHTGLVDMRGTTAPRLVLELIAARMLLPGAEDSTAALLARMERMERRITLADTDNPQTEVVRPAAPLPAGGSPDGSATGASAARAALAAATAARPAGRKVPAPEPSPSVDEPSGVAVPAPPSRPGSAAPTPSTEAGTVQPSVPSPVAAAADAIPADPPARTATGPGTVDAAGVRRIWDEVLSLVRRKSPRAAGFAREATVREVRGDVLVLLFKHSFHAESVAASPDLLQEALYEVLGGRWRILCEVVGQSPASADRDIPPAAGPGSGSSDAGSAARGAGRGPGGADASTPSGSGAVLGAPGASGSSAPAASARTTPGDSGVSGPVAPASGQPSASGSTGSGVPGIDGPAASASGRTDASGLTGSGVSGMNGPVASASISGTAGPSSVPISSGTGGSRDSRPTGPGSLGGSAGAGQVGPASTAAESSGVGRSGGGVATATRPAQPAPEVEEDWPETATLGGAGADGGVPPEPVTAVAAEARPQAAAAAPTRTPTERRPAANTGAAGAVERATARASAGPSAPRGGGRATNARPAPGQTAPPAQGRPGRGSAAAGRADDSWAGTGDEPPWDPEFDGPVGDPLIGFDPGDEPLDDEADLANRPTTEQQALELLRDALGAEKIGE